ncbi:MAG: PD40 domain-containing protein [Saprospirales bacterium]|jgi:tetratricopeptide (TPR) repeat protein|nr:PD40 domain-containing protein [Saprospirales bacterium]MBK8920382.1 PD40 domain-containing protein [Saprospirales bacterium]
MLKSISVLLPLFFLCALPWANGQQGIPERIGTNIHRGPSIKALESKARKSYSDGNYYQAMQYYRQILAVDSLHVGALEGYATAASAFTRYDEAARTYDFLLEKNLVAAGGPTLLRRAESRYLLGDYTEAQRLYQLADSLSSSADDRAAAKIGLNNCSWALKVHREMLDIPLDSLRDEINTPYAEYADLWAGDSLLYYSSYSLPLKGDTSRLLMQILEAQRQPDGRLGNIQPFRFNAETRHTAYITFNRDQTVMYYAVGKYAGGKKIRFELYRRKRSGESAWSAPEKLPRTVNMKGFSSTQPHICTLPGDRAETLFFVSDRPGGKGKKDIWYCQLQNDTFSAPQNLMLNTPGDDVTPFYHDKTGILYFSSTGRQGLGGFDIYRSERMGTIWKTPEHLPEPYNSNANDVFYSLSAAGKMAYFSSNRKGARNFSEEECCYDIFRAGLEKPVITITACNDETKDTLNYAEMTLYDLTPDGWVERSRVKVPGAKHPFPLLPGKSYMVITAKEGFVSDTFYFDSPQKILDTELAAFRCLRPARVKLLVSIMDGDSLMPMPGSTLVFATLSHLMPDGSLDSGPDGKGLLTQIKNAPDSSTYAFDLLFQHNYSLKASKVRFTSDSSFFSTIGLQGDTTIRRELVLRRGLDLDVYVFDDIKKDPLNDVTLRLIELRKPQQWTYQTGPQANDYHTIIYYDTRYRIVATKEGYSTDSLEFRTDDLDPIPFQRIRKELFLRPLCLECYLPIVLYFDNDEPGPHRIGVTKIKQEYRETYLPYYNRKQEYIDKFTAGLSGEALAKGQFDLDTFFERRVKGEWNRMRMFSEVLYEMLLNGDQINIKISGFASPLANSNYNVDLTSRRVSSIMNHFSIFDGGIYEPFIKSRQLRLIEVPRGEDKEAEKKGVSPDPANRRLSVFSVGAAKARRVEIVGVDVNGNEILLPLPQK